MIFALIQLVTISLVAVYLVWCDIALHRRNQRSWETIVARLRPDPEARAGLSTDFWRDRPQAPASKTAHRRPSRRSLWIRFVNAGVLLEMADFAGRNGRAVLGSGDAKLLDNLHRDAINIRTFAFIALARSLFPGPAKASV